MINFYNDFDNDPNDEVPHIMPIFAEIRNGEEKDDDMSEVNVDDIPILALRNMELFPGVAMPVAVGRTKSLKLIEDAQRLKIPIGVVCQ